jgi:DNA-binding transcriptional ArsR family regulator
MDKTGSGGPDSAALRGVHPEQVEDVRASMPGIADITDLADVFSLLGDPGRVRILIALLAGRMAVRDIAAAVDLSESAVSHALRLLRAHRVVDVTRDGRNAYYALADSHVRILLELGLEHVGHTVLLHPANEPGPDGRSGHDGPHSAH